MLQRRLSPDPMIGVKHLMGQFLKRMKEAGTLDLMSLVKPVDSKTNWKTAPSMSWLCILAPLFLHLAVVVPNRCFASSKLKSALVKLAEEKGCNKTTMTNDLWADQLDTWLRIASAQFRLLKKPEKYQSQMRKCSEKESEAIDRVLSLVEIMDKQEENPLAIVPVPDSHAVPSSSSKCLELAVKDSSTSKLGYEVFQRILDKKDSLPDTPEKAKASESLLKPEPAAAFQTHQAGKGCQLLLENIGGNIGENIGETVFEGHI